MKRIKFKAIECEICHKKYLRITNTHLWKEHQITIEEYKKMFPGASIDAEGLAKSRVHHLTDKTYEEIYGKEKAQELKNQRKISTSIQMQDPSQIEIRKNTIHECSEETKELISTAQTVHGASTYRKRALAYYGLECARCGFSTENPEDFVVHHKDFNNISSTLGNHSIENLVVLCKPCHAKLHNELATGIKKFVGLSSIERGVHYILKGLRDEFGLNLNDENFKDTPKRVARAYAEIFEGIQDTSKQVNEILDSGFPCQYDGMVIAKNIEAFSMCPHHLLPIKYEISAAYIPSKNGKVIGISKLSRLVEILAKRPVLQESLCLDITYYLMQLHGCQGAACIVDGIHFCMAMRGVKQSGVHTITSSIKGIFSTESGVKQEFFELIKNK